MNFWWHERCRLRGCYYCYPWSWCQITFDLFCWNENSVFVLSIVWIVCNILGFKSCHYACLGKWCEKDLAWGKVDSCVLGTKSVSVPMTLVNFLEKKTSKKVLEFSFSNQFYCYDARTFTQLSEKRFTSKHRPTQWQLSRHAAKT